MKREDLRVGGVYKHCKYPLFIVCTSLGEHGSLEGIALNNYNDIYQGDMCRSWFIPSFEPFDISLSLEQDKCEAVIKGDNLNYWHKVTDELPTHNDLVLVRVKNKNKEDGIYLYDICYIDEDTNTWGERHHTWENILEWKPID